MYSFTHSLPDRNLDSTCIRRLNPPHKHSLCAEFQIDISPDGTDTGADPGGGGCGGGRPPLGRKDPRRRRGFPRLKGKTKGHWCLLNGCSTPFRHNMAINILKSCKSVFADVKNRSFPSHIRSSFSLGALPWQKSWIRACDMCEKMVTSYLQGELFGISRHRVPTKTKYTIVILSKFYTR